MPDNKVKLSNAVGPNQKNVAEILAFIDKLYYNKRDRLFFPKSKLSSHYQNIIIITNSRTISKL